MLVYDSIEKTIKWNEKESLKKYLGCIPESISDSSESISDFIWKSTSAILQVNQVDITQVDITQVDVTQVDITQVDVTQVDTAQVDVIESNQTL